MAPILYMLPASAPVRAVLITAKAIGLNLIEKQPNVFAGEHLKPEYLKLNPQHTIPTLVDDGFAIWDSHAIIVYLVSKYAKNDDLYPEDLKKRAVINQRLHFESGVAFQALIEISKAVGYEGKTKLNQSNFDNVNQVYSFLEAFLEDKKWIAGDFLSIADYSIISTVSTLNTMIPVNKEQFPKVFVWMKQVEDLPEYQANWEGLHQFCKMIKSKLTNV